jgi:hypothetical protein
VGGVGLVLVGGRGVNVTEIGTSTSEERQALRALLGAVFGSSTGEEAQDFIEAAIGRKTMPVSMSSAEIDVVTRTLRKLMEGR